MWDGFSYQAGLKQFSTSKRHKQLRFPGSIVTVVDKLLSIYTDRGVAMPAIRIPPFDKAVQLIREQKHLTGNYTLAVPNEPSISSDPGQVQAFISKEVECKTLDELAPSLYPFAKRRSTHLDTLHEYDSTQRTVTVSENPGLHLVRHYHVIYCKPIPYCLLNYEFWEQFLTPKVSIQGQANTYETRDLSIECKSALGLIRSYYHLIKHESDFRVAVRVGLLPTNISYTQFQYFIAPFGTVSDDAVSPRYAYGHIRLTRLNIAVRILRPAGLNKRFPWTYDRMHQHVGQFASQFAAPLLFLFASLTLILSSLQVGLAAKPDKDYWEAFVGVSLWFSIVIIFLIIGVAAFAILGVVFYIANRVILGLYVNRTWMRNNFNGGSKNA